LTYKKRHAKQDQERRVCRLGARFTKSEQQEIAVAAAKSKMSQTDFILFLVEKFRKLGSNKMLR